ncbi:hypothetical protein [Streptomyces sp. NPDC005283]|uniref:hypothetical protein n=1 Tax=Streptomyces sp. NPDC005283 TaxID=3156871 RepID=UPI0034535B9C
MSISVLVVLAGALATVRTWPPSPPSMGATGVWSTGAWQWLHMPFVAGWPSVPALFLVREGAKERP